MRKLWFIGVLMFISGGLFAQVDDEKMEDVDEEIEIEAIEEDYQYEIDTTDIDLGDIEEDELSSEKGFPWNKFTVGGALGQFSFGDITNFGISPELTYKVTPAVRLGVGGTYEYFRQRDIIYSDRFTGQTRRLPEFSNTNYGGRAFLRAAPFKSIFGQLEYERLERDTPVAFAQDGQTVLNYEESLNNVNVGVGLAQAGIQNGGPYLLLFYNLMHKQNEDDFDDTAFGQGSNIPYPFNPISFRGGIDIPLGLGDKNKKKNKKRDSNKKRKGSDEEEKN